MARAWFFDYDNHSRIDRYSANTAGPGALHRNWGGGRFDDRSAAAGLADSAYGMGTLVADYDNDGDQDLYITCYGENILYRNEGQGHFVDASAQMGVGDGGFGAGAAAGDWDLDEDLYVYVVNSLDALEQAEAGYRRAIELKPKAREICIW